MVAAKKKIKDYLQKSVRKLKHRKGYGVHSPFAYAVITEVIEEKLPYYSYRRMQRTYDKQSPVSFKVACLLLRLANRFHSRQVLEMGCDGGYSMLPLILTDSRLQVTTLALPGVEQQARERLSWIANRMSQVTFRSSVEQIAEDQTYDFILLNANPFASQPNAEERLVAWLLSHSHDNTLIFVHGIQPRQLFETTWDRICDHDDISITMDLYDYGLAILKPRFFKQHYVVAF